jgi:type I restriction enzyme M protein
VRYLPDEGFSLESDSELRDTENIPLTYSGGIPAYFIKEVLPHVPDAWIDESKTVIGYEISFNKYFYVHQPLRDLAEVVKEIRDLEAETEGLLEQILSFSQ